MFSVTASEVVLPPYIVYKAKNLYPEWIEGGPDQAIYNRSESGWFDESSFLDWFFKIHFKNLKGVKCLIGDNVASHISFKSKILNLFFCHPTLPICVSHWIWLFSDL